MADPVSRFTRRSWTTSLVVHVALLITLLSIGSCESAPQARGGAEIRRTARIVLRESIQPATLFADEVESTVTPPNENERDGEPTANITDDVLAALPVASRGALELGDVLPRPSAADTGGSLEEVQVIGASEMTRAAIQGRTVTGGTARIGVYGLYGEGRKFIFVFDRSSSMGGPLLASAKSQLLKGLAGLEDLHQFQIIFFNHQMRIFDLSGGQNRIPFATASSKKLARRFVAGVTADGGTDRYAALLAAVNMRPDVIFFLTDEDDPMEPEELAHITRRNGDGAAIHVIEFGEGPADAKNNFLTRIARENHGGYVYVDTTRLGETKP